MKTLESPRALCTFSGGYDSTAALLWSLEQFPTRALFIDYKQPYAPQEREALYYATEECEAIVKHVNWRGYIRHEVDLKCPPGTRWIPYRNLVIAAVATNIAAADKDRIIVFGSKSAAYRPEDPVSYLDSTYGFYDSLEKFVDSYTEPRNQPAPTFRMPLMGWSKKLVLEYLNIRGVNLRKLWNCYRTDGQQRPCGECEHCQITQPLIDNIQDIQEG